ncbi:MBL fold metallo-hydrolase [Dethiobacter alkaliphilus]|uniref:MBL fold metallo-hydrolase n=1 Tax=Dethiobacter alkaliphilus TaxID=427926 RepID=UPI002226CFF5|nr:MBL fold metallo-hydrolase [Dethiobacter alkaliphilus]MCW3491419.1 MBL fold metallo-hydrolase [Dethiobacter alkaliphilus]
MQKITDTIYLVPGKRNGTFPYCHCLYIKDDVCGLIDSAAGKDYLKPVLGRVDVLINSHFHPDHVRGNGLFPKAHIRCHADDTPALESYEEMLRYTGYDRFTPEQIAKFMPIINHRPSRVDSTFTDGEILDFGRTKLRVIHVPGHTPGHCCFYEEKTGLMFGADIDLSSFGPWYAHELSDLEAFEKSLQKVIDINPHIFVSGHEDGYIRKGVVNRLKDYAQVFTARENMILKELKAPQTLEDLAAKQLIYPRHPEPEFFFYYFEWQMIKKHLEKMAADNKIITEKGKYLAANA